MTTDGGSWCILRTAGRSTLKLADTLAEDGFEVWTPRETRKIRVARSNVRRETVLPIMPSYVFAKREHLGDLLALEHMTVKPRRGKGWGKPAHAGFTVMRFAGDIPMISDIHLDALRRIQELAELKRIRNRKANPLPKGITVRVRDGSHSSWGGMVGKVERSNSKDTVIQFTSSRFVVKVRTSLLSIDDVGSDQCSLVSRAA